MARNPNSEPDYSANQRAWYEQRSSGLLHWLRAGGTLEEWADNTLDDIHFASQVLHLSTENTVLNLSCGWGRHAIALAHYGLTVIGLDKAASLLELARETSQQMNLSIRWVQGDLSDLGLTTPLDAVVQFNSNLLESTESPAEALYLLDQINAILKPNGRFLFGSANWQAVPPLHEQSQAESSDSTELFSYTFDPDSRIIQSQTTVIDRDGSLRKYGRHFWHPTAEQMADLLYQAGFHIEGQLNDFSFLPYDPNRPGLVWLAQKAG